MSGSRSTATSSLSLRARWWTAMFDIPAVARRRGWDEHELMHMVFEHEEEEEEGMKMTVA